MISRVTPSIRRTLVAARITAMVNGIEDGRRALQPASAAASSSLDKVAISLAECDMLASNLQPLEARQIFEREIEPLLRQLDHRTATLIADNKTKLQTTPFEGVGDFYHLVDARRILGVEIRDHASKLEAASQAADGKHYDALAMYWRHLRSSYELQNWRAKDVAETDFCDECILLGVIDEAAFHALLSGSNKAAERVGEVLLTCRDSSRIAGALKKILNASALREFAMQTGRILVKCADAVPDELLEEVSLFLSLHASFVPVGWHDIGLFESIWNAIKELAHRFNERSVRGLTQAALSHPALASGGVSRRHLVGALNSLTARALPDDLPSIAEVAIGLVTDGRSDLDYTESLNLLCHAAGRAGEEIRSKARTRLFPSGAEIKDSLLVQAGPFLGWRPQRPESFSDGAMQTAVALRKQVQRLAPGEEPAKIGGYGTFSSADPTGQIVVHMQGAMHQVQAIRSYRAMISDEAIHALFEAILAMIGEAENVISNRVTLVFALGDFLDRLPQSFDKRTVEVLEPLAIGDITEPSYGQSHAAATNPLNPFRVGGGDPVDLQGAAMKLLCMLDRSRPGACPTLHNALLINSLTAANAEIRRYGLHAASHGANLTAAENSTIALSGLDADPRVARLAVHAMIESGGTKNLDALTWQIVVRVVESAINSTDGGYRASASRMLRLLPPWPSEVIGRLQAATNELANDALFSVRKPFRD